MPNLIRRLYVSKPPVITPFSKHRLRGVTEGGYPYPVGYPILVSQTNLVLLGSSRVKPADRSIDVLVLHAASDPTDALLALDAAANPLPSVKAKAAAAMRSLGVPLTWVKAILGCTDLGTTSRWTRLASLPWPVLQAMDRNLIQMGHARQFLGRSPAQVMDLLSRCRIHQWSAAKLRSVLAGKEPSQPAPSNADITAYAEKLTDALGAAVRIHWPESPKDRRISIAWYDVETLKGVLAQLAQGPVPEETADPAEAIRREVEFSVRDATELDALTGHLVS